MNFELIYSYNDKRDITNDIIANSYNYTKRCDVVFGSGSMQLESTTLTKNIPPYTILKETNGDSYDYFLCSSSCSRNLITDTYYHNVDILEGTSILSRFILGTKALSNYGSNKSDVSKINLISSLIQRKYNITINVLTSNFHLINDSKEYVFGAGTTLFDALNEIASQYNCRVKVKYINYNSTNELVITIDFVSLFGSANSISYENLTIEEQMQNVDNYCGILESEATNVIDRSSLVKVDFLTAKSSEVKLSEDTAQLELPTRVESVAEFGISYMPAQFKMTIEVNSSVSSTTTKTYGQWVSSYPDLETFYTNFLSQFFPDKTSFYAKTFTIFSGESTMNSTDMNSENYITGGRLIEADLSHHITSKEKWELLEDKDKPLYAYYTSGSNIISGLNTYYKNDFWNSLLGETVNSFMDKLDVDVSKYLDTTVNGITLIDFDARYDVNTYPIRNVVEHTFYVKYFPISNPFLSNEKTVIPVNESSYKKYALSYNKSSNYIDFDKINNAMRIENESLGREELVLTLSLENNIPEPTQSITYNNTTWYIASVQTTYNIAHKVCIVNLVKSYNKLADIIGLNTQYNATKLPMDNIIERPILLKVDDRLTLYNGNCYFMLKIGNKLLFKSLILMQDEYHNKVGFVEMVDNYCFDKQAIKVDEGIYKMQDVSYVDSSNTLDYAYWSIVTFNETPNAKELPLTTSQYTQLLSDKLVYLYKDAREKLTFTIQLNNCIIK